MSSQPVTSDHVEKETLTVNINLPGHDERETTALFTHSRKALLKRDGGRCFVCERTEAEAGPLEAHHWLVERCAANVVDIPQLRALVEKWLVLINAAKAWLDAHPGDFEVMSFVDDMTAQGMLLCKEHHTHPDSGIHTMPEPLWAIQAYGKAGFQFEDGETLVHDPVQEVA